jgi:parallel beta-helix repeat protein
MAATEIFTNQAQTTVSSGGTGAPSSGTVETWTVASSSSFPAASSSATPPTQFHVCDTAAGKTSEIIAVTNVSGTTWTVTRGAEGSTPVTHASGFTVMQDVTAGFLGSVATGKGSGVTVLVPAPTGATATDTPNVVAAISSLATALASGPATLLFQDGTYQVDSNSAVIRSPNTTTVASASNSAEPSTWVPGATGTLTVASATGFPSAGQLWLAASGNTIALIAYTGTTSTTFTGCTYLSGSVTGTLSTGGAVTGVLSNFTVRSAGRTVIAQAPNRSGNVNNATGNILTIADCTGFAVEEITFDALRDTLSPVTPLTATAASGQPSVTVASGQGARYLAGQYLYVFGGLGTADQNTADGFGVGSGTPLTVSSVTTGGGSGGGDLVTFTANLANTYTYVSGTLVSDAWGPYACTGAYLTPYQCGSGNSVAGRSLSGEDQQNGLHLIGCQRFTVSRCTSRNLWESGFKCGTGEASTSLTDGCQQGAVTDCITYHGYDQGVSLWVSQYVTVKGCQANSSGWAGISMTSSDHCSVTGNHLLSMTYRAPNDVSNGNGITIEGGLKNQVHANVISSPYNDGIHLSDSPLSWGMGTSGHFPTTSAFLEQGTAAGTSVQLSSTAYLEQGGLYSICDAEKTEAVTVASIADGTHVTFGGATTFSHASGTYLIPRVAQENVIEGNTVLSPVTGNCVHGFGSTRDVIKGNVLTAPAAGAGVSLVAISVTPQTPAGGGSHVEGNMIRGTGAAGVDVEGVSGVTVAGNHITGLGGVAGILAKGVLDSSVGGNYIAGGTNAQGIYMQSGGPSNVPCSRVSVTGNVIRQMSNEGMLIYSATSLTVSGNIVGSCGGHAGISLRGVSQSSVTGNTCNSNSVAGIKLEDNGGTYCLSNVVSGNVARQDGSGYNVTTGASYTQQYGIQETGTSNYNLFTGNEADTNSTGQVVTSGASSYAWDNVISGAVAAGTAPPQSYYSPSGLTGATAASRYVGATAGGAPASGTFVLGDWVLDQAGAFWVCTTGGSPGTWAEVYPGTGLTNPMTTSGDTIYGGSSGTPARLAGNTAAAPKVLTQTGTGSASAAPAWTAQDYGGLFGDGSDGTVAMNGTNTFSGFASLSGSTYTLSRDVFATSLTVSSGVTVLTNGYRVFCQGTVTNGGTVSFPGNNAASATGGTHTNSGTLQGGQAGGSGSAASAGANGTIASGSAGTGNGGAGGAGSSTAGGAARASNLSTPFPYRTPYAAAAGAFTVVGVACSASGANGGSGGGGDGTNSGGGGGSGAGIIVIFAWSVVNTGTISANGGNGFTPATGNCGGGGGGGGGLILIYTLTAWTAGTTSVTGGTLGSGVGTGAAGTAGGSGSVLNVIVQ